MRLVGGIGNSLQAIQDKLVQALKALKALRVRVKKEASKRTVTELFPNMQEETSRLLLFNMGLEMAAW